MRCTPKFLVIHPNDIMTARELLGSTLKPGTTNNEINAIRDEGLTFMDTPYLTDTNSWFLVGDEHDINLGPPSRADDGYGVRLRRREAEEGSVLVRLRVVVWFGVEFGDHVTN